MDLILVAASLHIYCITQRPPNYNAIYFNLPVLLNCKFKICKNVSWGGTNILNALRKTQRCRNMSD